MKILAFGEILYDIFDDTAEIGGAPLNFAAHFAGLGGESYIISAVGRDELGQKAIKTAHELGVHTEYIQSTDFQTGFCHVSRIGDTPIYDLSAICAYDHIEASKEDEKGIEAECFDVLYFGTLAQRNAASKETLDRLLDKRCFKKVFFDMNIRQHYYSRELLEQSLGYSDIVKINRDEFNLLKTMNLCGDEKSLCRKFGIEMVLLTLDKDGISLYDAKTDTAYTSAKPQNKVVSTVGAGDASSACFLYNYLSNESLDTCVQRANIMGDYIVTCTEAIPAYSSELLKQLNDYKERKQCNMKSAVFYGKHDLRIEEVPMPKPDDNEVLIKVMACGICGTDVHIYKGDEGAAATPPQTILGHEFAGIVENVGSRVKSVKIGDRVCVDPNKLCNECSYCKNGIGHFCESMIGIGTTVDGGFSEYCKVPESQVYPFADGLSFEEAAMCEPVACCMHGIDMCEINPGDTVMVIGGGMIGLIMLQLAQLKGASKLILLEPVEEKRQHAKRLGADICIDPIHEDVRAVLADNGIARINCVIECVGKPSTMEQAISYAGNKSTVMLFGLTKPNDVISIKPFKLFKKEIVLKASFINPYTQQRALDLIASHRIDVSSIIHEVAPLEDLVSILSNTDKRSKGKFIIKPQN